jgi:hypothetical protein
MPKLLYPGTSDRPAADAVGVAGPFGAERLEKELLVERFLDVELH